MCPVLQGSHLSNEGEASGRRQLYLCKSWDFMENGETLETIEGLQCRKEALFVNH